MLNVAPNNNDIIRVAIIMLNKAPKNTMTLVRSE